MIRNLVHDYRCHLMVRSIHYEGNARCNLAELSDNEFVPVKIIMVQHMLFKISITEVCKIAYYYVGVLNCRSYMGDGLATCHRENDTRIWFHILMILPKNYCYVG